VHSLDARSSQLAQELLERLSGQVVPGFRGSICFRMEAMELLDGAGGVERSRLQIELILRSLNPSSGKRRGRASR